MDKMKMHTVDITDGNVEKIGQLFPNCLTERVGNDGKVEKAIDFDLLRQELSKDIVEGAKERYQFTWPDKKKAIRKANTSTTMTLRPVRVDEKSPTGSDSEGNKYLSSGSVDFENTQNLYIEGDNLEVLKLIRENYLGKIKVIYIDPPYNTGGDFVYDDDFTQEVSLYVGNSGQIDVLGNQLVQNTESNGRFHTDWLNMIYPRLKVAKDLLSSDGVILISIDDCESSNMHNVCNEIFGSNNRIATLVWNCSTAGGIRPKHTSKTHEYVLVYAKDINNVPMLWAPLSEDAKKMYNERDETGLFRCKEFVFKNASTNKNQKYEIVCPDGTIVKPKEGYIYRFVPETFEEAKKNDLVVFRKTDSSSTLIDATGKPAKWNIFIKKYFGDGLGCPATLLPKDMIGMYNKGTQDVQLIFDNKRVFENVKPVSLIHYLIQVFGGNDSIILDFFSGSATTAHAVIYLNSEDDGKRKFIMVQLPEVTDKNSEAYKSGYKNICEIGKERIRRAGKKVLEDMISRTDEGGLFASANNEKPKLDVGFRVLKLDTSNMEDVYYRPEDSSEATLFEDNVKPDRTGEDLLFQVMLECNLPLSAKIETEKIAGKEVFSVNNGYLIACFDEDVNEEVITAVAKRKPYYFIMRDKSLSSDNVADNFEQIFQAYSKETIRRIL
ncbi:MAG: site-specific DNA-methyltransferase [Bacteroidales bacterium]|nr:site-specific DNA-methyltransferase [Bacteroidales bacterium]